MDTTTLTLADVENLQRRFSEDQLLEIVRKARPRADTASGFETEIESGICKPSLVWEYHFDIWNSVADKTAQVKATIWKSECLRLLVEATEEAREQQRLESSAPSNVEDAAVLAKTWVQVGEIPEVPSGKLPKGLSKEFEALIGESLQATANGQHQHPEHATASIVRAVCRTLRLPFIEGLCGKGTNFPCDIAILKDQKEPHIGDEEVVAGVIELKGFAAGVKTHAAALVQAAKYSHHLQRDSGKVVAIWGRVDDYGVALQFRVGVLSWTDKRIVATEVHKVQYSEGKFRQMVSWQFLCAHLRSMRLTPI